MDFWNGKWLKVKWTFLDQKSLHPSQILRFVSTSNLLIWTLKNKKHCGIGHLKN